LKLQIDTACTRPILTADHIRSLELTFDKSPVEEVLAWAWNFFGSRAAIGTSFQGAGLVMIHLSRLNHFDFPVFTLDTGLLFPETVELRRALEDFFGMKIESVEPDLTIQQQADAYGAKLWNYDPDLCCTLRKVLPLRDKLTEVDCWITGLRRQQSHTRAGIGVIEVYGLSDGSDHNIIKLNPMANWTHEAVWAYLREHKIPYNPLHDRGYCSIGCQPCTRATESEGGRAGRWMGFNKIECGIHTFMQKKRDVEA
jgi:phosphoadenosine phosphosulfate reductase